MNKIRIIKRNLLDTATVVDSPACSITLPASNLQRQTERERTARSTSLAAQNFTFNFAAPVTGPLMLGATRHNWSTSATWQWQIYDAVGSPQGTLYDSGALTAFSTAGLDTDLDVYTERDFRGLKNSFLWTPSVTNAAAALQRTTDAANADGYIEATRMWLGKYIEFTYDPPFGGVDFVPMDNSKAGRSDDGTHLVDKGWKARKLTFQLAFVSDADMNTLLGLARYLGKDKECCLSLFSGEGGDLEMYHSGAFRLTESPTFNPFMTEAQTHRASLVFEET